MSKTDAPHPAKRFAVKVDSGREFIIYAPNRAGAVQRLLEAGMAGALVYEGGKQVPVRDLGHVVNARELTAGEAKGKVLVDL